MHPKIQERRDSVHVLYYAQVDTEIVEAQGAVGRKVRLIGAGLIGELEAMRAERQLKTCVHQALSLPPTTRAGRMVRGELIHRLKALNDYLDDIAESRLQDTR